MKYLILLVMFFSISASAAQPQKMVVIVSDAQKKALKGVSDTSNYINSKGAVFNIYSLDDVDNFESYFSKGLPSDESKAREMVKQKYDELGEEKLRNMVLKAYTAKILTLRHKIEKYPAIIFDDTYVVYGEFDLNKALNFYLGWEDQQ